MGKLSTHVLDTASGKPAQNIKIELFKKENDVYRLLKSTQTNADGRTDELLLDASAIEVGQYKLLFHVHKYFLNQGITLPTPPFFDAVPIEFGIAFNDQNYHVPLLISPWSYSTYRGS